MATAGTSNGGTASGTSGNAASGNSYSAASGSTGSSGSGWTSGNMCRSNCSLGQATVADLSAGPMVCGSSCGDGHRDVCGVGGDFSCPICATEPCDGLDLGGASCTSLGFARGTLSCTSKCQFDTSNCSGCNCGDCAPLDSHLVACTGLPTVVRPSDLAVAASDQGLALAWSTRDGAVWWQGLGVDLTPIGAPVVVLAPGTFPDVTLAAFASTPSGWALAILHQTGLEVETLDTVGALVSRFQLATGPASSGRSVGLASQAGAGPLVAWRDDAALFVAFLSVDGKTHTAPATVPLPDAAAGNVSATFVGDAFLVSTASSRGALASGPVYVIRMLLDGALDGVPKPLLQEVQMRDGYEFYKW
ncbi:MAG TPA: hypothetical protein VGY54_22100, partial [Polyangiaceae bacterium]|nr:hypothetical protein [Polyangiaceae bacterium]